METFNQRKQKQVFIFLMETTISSSISFVSVSNAVEMSKCKEILWRF